MMKTTPLNLYEVLRQLYQPEEIRVGNFVNPLFHNSAFKDIQFVDRDGKHIPPFHPEAETFLHPDPLVGPFYDLPLEGIAICPPGDENWTAIQAIALLHRQMIMSSGILVKRLPDDLVKDLGTLIRINWYRIDDLGCLLPIHTTGHL